MRRWICRAVPALIVVAAAAACGRSPTAPSAFAPFSQQDLRQGTGGTAVTGSRLSVNYTLWLFDASRVDNKGAQIETSRGIDPFEFTLGAGQAIAGWDQGLVGLQEGGVRRLTIPPSLAYGPERNGSLPPYATLVFEVELLDIVE